MKDLKKMLTRLLIAVSMMVWIPVSQAARVTLAPDATIKPIGTSLYNNTTAAFFGNGNWNNVTIEGVADALFKPYTLSVGPVAYIIVTGILGVVMYIKTESVIVPGIVLAADGVLFMWWLPYDFQYIAYGFVIIGVVAMILGLLMRRRY